MRFCGLHSVLCERGLERDDGQRCELVPAFSENKEEILIKRTQGKVQEETKTGTKTRGKPRPGVA